MKTQTPEQAREQLAAAEAEKREAEQLAAALAEKVRAGDESVQPADLTAARELAEFADLRLAAARRKLDDTAEADRHRRATQAAAEVRRLVEETDEQEIAVKMRTAVDALADLYATAADRRTRILGMVAQVRAVAAEMELAGVAPNYEIGKRYGVAADHDSVSSYRPKPIGACGVTPARMVAAAMGLAVRTNGEQAEVAEQMTTLSYKVDQVLTQIPALRAEFAPAESGEAA